MMFSEFQEWLYGNRNMFNEVPDTLALSPEDFSELVDCVMHLCTEEERESVKRNGWMELLKVRVVEWQIA